MPPLLREQLDASHVGAIAGPVPHLEDAGVAAGTGGEARAELGEEPAQDLAVLDVPAHEPARVQVATAGQGDELLGEGPQLLGLGFGGADAPRA